MTKIGIKKKYNVNNRNEAIQDSCRNTKRSEQKMEGKNIKRRRNTWKKKYK